MPDVDSFVEKAVTHFSGNRILAGYKQIRNIKFTVKNSFAVLGVGRIKKGIVGQNPVNFKLKKSKTAYKHLGTKNLFGYVKIFFEYGCKSFFNAYF